MPPQFANATLARKTREPMQEKDRCRGSGNSASLRRLVYKQSYPVMIILGVLTLFAVFIACLPIRAEEYRQGDLVFTDPWTRPTPGGSTVGAAYLTIRNQGKAADKLLAVASPAADHAELHENIHEGDVMGMREVTGGLAIPPGKTVTFAPGGYHIMLFGLKQKLQEGQTIPLLLRFAKAGEQMVTVKVRSDAPTPNPGQPTQVR
jgi:copper(I)-binding protein